MIRWWEIVWTFRGREYSLRTHPTAASALADFDRGPSRCHVLVHGGSIRVDEVTAVPS